MAKIIHDRNGEAAQKINLKGIVANSGFLNAYELTHFSDYLFQVGLFSPGQYVAGQLIEARIRGAIQSGDLRQASTVLLEYMVGSATSNNVSFLSMATGLTTSDNILFTESPPVFRHFQEFVQLPVVRRAIHVAQREFVQYNPQVMNALIDEFVTNVTTILEELINVGYKVLMMSGNLDQYVVPVVYNRIANGLTWKYAESFRNSSRIIWKVDPTDVDVAGYSNCAFNLCLVMVRNAGHRMPYDQIRSTLDAVRRFVHDLPFN